MYGGELIGCALFPDFSTGDFEVIVYVYHEVVPKWHTGILTSAVSRSKDTVRSYKEVSNLIL